MTDGIEVRGDRFEIYADLEEGFGDGRGGSRKRPPMQLIEVDQVEIESSANGGPDPVSDEELEEIVEGFLIKDGQQGPCGL